jgi:hypothetical protein
MTEKRSLPEALRAEILKLATDGDEKSAGALTADVLLRIMRVAKTGRDLLVSLNASPSNLASMIKRPAFGFGSAQNVNSDDGDLESSGILWGSPFAQSSPSENFGMMAMREIIAAAKNIHNGKTSPAELVEALIVARKEGLSDVAKELEAQLGVGKCRPVLEKAQDPEQKEPAQ